MIYIVYVQGIELAKFNSKDLADWFVCKLRDGNEYVLNLYVNQFIDSNYFQDCEITVSVYDREGF